MSETKNTCSKVLIGVGSFLLIVGIALGISWPFLFKIITKHELKLSQNSQSYKMWIKTPIPMYLDIYLFNWTNKAEFLKDFSVKPKFEEIGPFIFEEVHERVNVTWNPNDTVTFHQKRTWHFIPEESTDLNVHITNLNVVASTVAYMTRRNASWIKAAVNIFLKLEKEQLFVTKTAREWLFEGYHDPVLAAMNELQNITKIHIPYDKFGFFYGRNESITYDGVFNMFTGGDDISKLGLLSQWNYMNKTNNYQSYCALVNGSTGELFPPMLDFQNDLTIFASDLCGSLTLNYESDDYSYGIHGYKYLGNESVFDNGTLYPDRKCSCRDECIPSGVMDISRCRQGAPAFVSYPHFYLADPVYRNNIEGMEPNKTKHQFIISLEPETGIPLHITAKFQINILLRRDPSYSIFKNVPNVYVPMLWFDQNARMTPKLANVASMLINLDIIGVAVLFSIAGLGFLLLLGGICSLIIRMNSKDGEPEYSVVNSESSEHIISS